MKFYLDTEFIEDGQTIDLISIGITSEHGEILYLESSEVDWAKASSWVLENVKPHLDGVRTLTRDQIRREIVATCGATPEFWGYYCDYDWVVLCQLFGTMMDLPEGWPMYCRDLRQWLDDRGLQQVRQPDDMPHNAFSDSEWIADTHRIYSDVPGGADVSSFGGA